MGAFLDVTDAEIIEAYKLLGGQEGMFCEPASAASVAGLLKRKDEVPDGATVVCVLTGNGLKDPDCAINNNDAAFHTDLNPRSQHRGPRDGLRSTSIKTTPVRCLTPLNRGFF